MGEFYEKLKARWQSTGSLLCVGLDPVPQNLSEETLSSAAPYGDYCNEIVDATAEFACAFKYQAACFSGQGREGELQDAIGYCRSAYPDIPIILDAKRGDIGSTAKHYADEAFMRYGADAATVNPYLGGDSIQPFTDYADRGVILLCRTSNPGSSELQELQSGNMMIYEHVAQLAAGKWNRNCNVALVVGATYPEVLARVRRIVGDMPLLVPGIGAQGGDLEAVLQHGLSQSGDGLMINVSRAIGQAGRAKTYSREDSLHAVHDAAKGYFNLINSLRPKLP